MRGNWLYNEREEVNEILMEYVKEQTKKSRRKNEKQ